MKSVKVKREDLLSILKENCSKHVAAYQEAVVNYRLSMIAEMKKNLAQAEAGGEIVTHIYEDKPLNYESQYSTVIRMAELSTDEVIELSYSEFQQYVMDNWSWKPEWTSNTMKYCSVNKG